MMLLSQPSLRIHDDICGDSDSGEAVDAKKSSSIIKSSAVVVVVVVSLRFFRLDDIDVEVDNTTSADGIRSVRGMSLHLLLTFFVLFFLVFFVIVVPVVPKIVLLVVLWHIDLVVVLGAEVIA